MTEAGPGVGEGDVSEIELPFRHGSDTFAVVMWSTWFLLSLGIGAATLLFLIPAAMDLPGQPANAWKGLCLSIGLSGMASMIGVVAWPGLVASWQAHRQPGSLLILGDHLVFNAPGLLDSPGRVERSWVSGVRDRPPWPTTRTSRLTLSLSKPSLMLEFSTPLCFPTASAAPQQMKVPLASPPTPWEEVDFLVLVLEEPSRGAAALHSWLSDTIPTADVPPPVACVRPAGTKRPIAISSAVMVAGVIGLWAGILISPGR